MGGLCSKNSYHVEEDQSLDVSRHYVGSLDKVDNVVKPSNYRPKTEPIGIGEIVTNTDDVAANDDANDAPRTTVRMDAASDSGSDS